MELLQRALIGFAERNRELLILVFLHVLERFACEGHSAQQPDQTLRCGPLLFALLVLHQFLERVRKCWCRFVARANFLYLRVQIR